MQPRVRSCTEDGVHFPPMELQALGPGWCVKEPEHHTKEIQDSVQPLGCTEGFSLSLLLSGLICDLMKTFVIDNQMLICWK